MTLGMVDDFLDAVPQAQFMKEVTGELHLIYIKYCSEKDTIKRLRG